VHRTNRDADSNFPASAGIKIQMTVAATATAAEHFTVHAPWNCENHSALISSGDACSIIEKHFEFPVRLDWN
jgi:hypothetical protein